MRVTHDYHPSANPNLYEVTVTVENISAVPVDLRYRRVMDWDIDADGLQRVRHDRARQRGRHPVHERRRFRDRQPARRAVVDAVHRRSGRQRPGGPRFALRLRLRRRSRPVRPQRSAPTTGRRATRSTPWPRSSMSAPRRIHSVSRAPSTARPSARRTRSCSRSRASVEAPRSPTPPQEVRTPCRKATR